MRKHKAKLYNRMFAYRGTFGYWANQKWKGFAYSVLQKVIE